MIKKNIDKYSSYEILELFQSVEFKTVEHVELELSSKSFEDIGIKALVDISQIFFFKIQSITCNEGTYMLHLKKLDVNSSFHNEERSNEKYGVESEFFSIDKTKEFSFLHYYIEALKFVDIYSKKSILNIGVNKGDEFLVIQKLLSQDKFRAKEFLGLDYSKSAIEFAKKEFEEYENVNFTCADINELEKIELDRYELLISIGTLQSSNINFNAKFMELFQNHLAKEGAVVLGFPNCRWIDGEMVYGAKVPNYSFNEMGLVLKDIHFCKKYLQQKGYRVVITGKDYLFLSARKISKN